MHLPTWIDLARRGSMLPRGLGAPPRMVRDRAGRQRPYHSFTDLRRAAVDDCIMELTVGPYC